MGLISHSTHSANDPYIGVVAWSSDAMMFVADVVGTSTVSDFTTDSGDGGEETTTTQGGGGITCEMEDFCQRLFDAIEDFC